jgi:hypothetical protein
MPQIGSNKNPVFLRGADKKRGKQLGLTGKFYSSDSLKNYQDNYDSIFKNNGSQSNDVHDK